MIKRFGRTACVMLAASVLAAPAMAAANGETYKTRLSVVPLDVGMQATVAGQGSVTATLAGNKLTVSGTAEGLRSPATVAHIHRGPPGIPGPAILDLTITNTTTPTISGTVDLTPSMVADLKNGQLYVQLSSERAPDGNLRGWLMHAN
ncbi:MAG TPA: CHRD domain-containing protein [Micropepsaceae bacterium]|nr:CHRD domain-containing protein [Micropepsaceae bacterium]